MRSRTPPILQIAVLVVGIAGAVPFISPNQFGAHAQIGNTISGFVFGLERRPVADAEVELLDEVNSAIARARTNGSGQYVFHSLSSGRFTVRVRPFMTEYQEQEQSVQIQSFPSPTGTGVPRPSSSHEQIDFYLKLKKGITPAMVLGSLFAQDVPPEAKKLYDRALTEFEAKRDTEAYASLKAALEIFPKYFAALERLGTAYLYLKKPAGFQAAQVLLTIAIEVNPRAYKSWYGLAYALYAQAKHAEALPAAQQAVELNAYSAEYACLYGILMRYAKKYADAEKQLVKAKELSNDSMAEVHWELALLYGNELKRYADAARELKLFLKARPDAKDAENIRKLIANFETKAATKT